MSIYLYRAVLAFDKSVVVESWEDGELDSYRHVMPAGTAIGRKSGYLSRSSAVAAAYREGLAEDEFKIVRSEPVEFLSDAEKLRREIQRLTAELAAVEAVPGE